MSVSGSSPHIRSNPFLGEQFKKQILDAKGDPKIAKSLKHSGDNPPNLVLTNKKGTQNAWTFTPIIQAGDGELIVSRDKNDDAGGLQDRNLDTIDDSSVVTMNQGDDDSDVQEVSIKADNEKKTIEEDSKTDNEKKSNMLRNAGIAAMVAGGILVLVGLAVTCFTPFFPPCAVIGPSIAFVGAGTFMAGATISQATMPQEGERMTKYMDKFETADSYKDIRAPKDKNHPNGCEEKGTTLEQLAHQTASLLSDDLKALDKSYEALKDEDIDLDTCPDNEMMGLAKSREKPFKDKIEDIRKWKIPDEKREELEDQGCTVDDIENYETYWKNFFVLKAAQRDETANNSNKFFKR